MREGRQRNKNVTKFTANAHGRTRRRTRLEQNKETDMNKEQLTIPSTLQEVLGALGNASKALVEYKERMRLSIEQKSLEEGMGEAVSASLSLTATDALHKACWKIDEAVDLIISHVSENIKEAVYE